MAKIRIPATVWIVCLIAALLVFPFVAKSQYQQHVMVMTLMAAITASS